MHELSIKKSISSACSEYIKWILNPRIIIIMVFIIFMKASIVDHLILCSKNMKSPLNIFEPFIAVSNSGLFVLILPLLYLTLISDFPRTDGNTLFTILRIGRVNWLIGQFIFIILSIATFIFIVFASSIAFIFFNAFIGNNWSIAVTQYSSHFPQSMTSYVNELIQGNLYNQMKIYNVVVHSSVLLCGYLSIIGLILLLFCVLKIKKIGLFISALTISLGTATTALHSDIMWIFPMANAIIWLHYTEYFSAPVKPIIYSYIYFIIAIIALVFICFCVASKLSFENVTEVDG